jgi:oligopeptide transport system permease protein
MRYLFPVEFGDLGAVESLWLFLALALLAPRAGRPVRSSLLVAALVAAVGLLRKAALPDDAGAWDRFGPVLFAPAFAAAVVAAGRWRPRGRRADAAGVGALVLLSLAGRPFSLHPVRDLAEWAFLAFFGLAAAWVAGPRPPPRARWAVAGVFLVLCAWARPFGVGWAGAAALLAANALVHAVVAQGPQMTRYVLRRLAGAPVVLFVLLLLSFALMRLAPGSPFDKEKRVDPEQQKLQEARYGLDRPLPEQFRIYMVKLAWDGDLGISTKQKDRTVNEIIAHHSGPSVALGVAAIAIALLVGVTSGLVAGIRRNSIFDYASMTGAMLGLALPTFVVGPMLVLVFAMRLDWFHVSGWTDFPRDLVLPAITLSLPFLARIARLTRAGMLEVVNQDYVRTARAKGLSEPVIVFRHTLKGALLPVVSFLGPAVAQVLTGSLVVERIFGVPGLGMEFVQSAFNRDYGLAMGLVLLFGTLLIAFNLVVDVAYGFLDPRIRHA